MTMWGLQETAFYGKHPSNPESSTTRSAIMVGTFKDAARGNLVVVDLYQIGYLVDHQVNILFPVF